MTVLEMYFEVTQEQKEIRESCIKMKQDLAQLEKDMERLSKEYSLGLVGAVSDI